MRKIITLIGFMLLMPVISPSPTIDDWYEVEDWEIDVCSKYGGTAEAQKSVTAKAQGDSYMYQTTVTLQGYKSETSGDYVYEAAWYFRPMDADQEYKIEFIGSSGTKEVYKGTATKELGDANYHAEESSTEYDKLKISYETGDLMVPFVEK